MIRLIAAAGDQQQKRTSERIAYRRAKGVRRQQQHGEQARTSRVNVAPKTASR